MKLSAVIIARNAQDQIEDAISSVNFADEVIVIDNSSTDKTKELSQKKGASVFSIESKSFSDLRNYGLQKAQGDWVLYIDADERVTPQLKKEITEIINNNELSVGAYKIPRKNFYFGSYEWPHVEKLERLFLKSSLQKWYGIVHESPVIKGKVKEVTGYVLHYTHRDLASMLEKTIEWSKLEADLRFNSHHPKMTWWRFPRVIMTSFFESYVVQGGWKIGIAGLVESIYQSFSLFITYARLWEMQEKNKTKNS